MKCVIVQPSYIPWRGYFHQIAKADLFVFYDDVGYDRRGWRNRNRVKSANGMQWLSIPVLNKGSRRNHTPICDIEICWDDDWRAKHWRTLEQAYSRAPSFDDYAAEIEPLYRRRDRFLSDFTIAATRTIAGLLGIDDTEFARSSALGASGRKTERLLDLLQRVGATHYITGPTARDYLDEKKLRSAGISVEYMSYRYPPYAQLHGPFDPYVSVLDLLFVAGRDAPRYIWAPDLDTAAASA